MDNDQDFETQYIEKQPIIDKLINSDETIKRDKITSLDKLVAFNKALNLKSNFMCVWDSFDITDPKYERQTQPSKCGIKLEGNKVLVEKDKTLTNRAFFEEYGGDDASLVSSDDMYYDDYEEANKEKENLYSKNMLSFPQMDTLTESELIKQNMVNEDIVNKISNHIKIYNQHEQKNWNKLLTNPKLAKKEYNPSQCPKTCTTKVFTHGTSMKRAENIQKFGFYEVTDKPKSDLAKGIIGRDMRENMGGVGEQGLSYFCTDHKCTPESHAIRVSNMDKDVPAIVEFEGCMCNYLTKYDTLNPEFISTLKTITEKESSINQEQKVPFRVRFYAIEPTISPVDLFQRLSTKETNMGEIMDKFNIDGLDENDEVAVLRNPNKNMKKETFKIYTLKEYKQKYHQ